MPRAAPRVTVPASGHGSGPEPSPPLVGETPCLPVVYVHLDGVFPPRVGAWSPRPPALAVWCLAVGVALAPLPLTKEQDRAAFQAYRCQVRSLTA